MNLNWIFTKNGNENDFELTLANISGRKHVQMRTQTPYKNANFTHYIFTRNTLAVYADGAIFK